MIAMPSPSLRAIGITLLCLSAGCGSAKHEPAEAEAKPTSNTPPREVTLTAEQIQHGGVRWAAVRTATMTDDVEAPGRLVANDDNTARLSAPVRGRIVAVRVRLGDRVSRGQPLVTFQSQEADAARADHAKAQAELNARQAAAVFARTARERAERLLELKAVSQQEVERARVENDAAESARAQAQADLDRTRATLTHLGVNAETGEMVLRSPLSGVVLSRDATPGAIVEPGAPLVIVTDPTTLWLDVAATERVASSLRPGAAVRFTVAEFADDTFDASILNVGGALDPATRTLPVRGLVRNRALRLRPEMFATVKIQKGAPRPGVTVPDAAIQMLDERPVVFVAVSDNKGGGRFERRDVELGAKADGRTQILRGLEAGAVVVTEGAFAVKSEFARGKMPAEG